VGDFYQEHIIGKAEEGKGGTASLPAELFDVKEKLKDAFCLKPGDEIEIRVFGRNDLTITTVVPLEGSITFPLVGKVEIAGVSPQEIELRIKKALKKELVAPQVSVLMKRYAPRNVYLLGEVRSSGGFPIQPGECMMLSQLLSLAGGFTKDADRQHLRLMRFVDGKRKIYTLSFSRLVLGAKRAALQKRAEIEQDIPLIPEDVVLVGKMEYVYILGCVKNPGGYSLGEEVPTLTKIIATAGGLTRLASHSVQILRHKEFKKIRVDIDAVHSGEITDPRVKAGDVIFVPESIF
jgi:polysaccharide export outer membrane protein